MDFIPLCKAISLTSFATTVNSMGAVDRPNGSALNCRPHPGHKTQVLPGLILNGYMEVGVFKIYGRYPLPSLEGGLYCIQCLHFELLRLEELVQIAEVSTGCLVLGPKIVS